MEKTQDFGEWIKSRKTVEYVFLTCVVGVAIYFTTRVYTDIVLEKNQGKVALFVTLYFVGGIYIGRYLSQLWIIKHTSVPRSLLITLLILILVCIVAIFFTAQLFITVNRVFLTLLFLGLPLLILSIASGMMIKLVRTTIKNQLEEAKVTAEHSKSELKFLQTQLSPHFLFNTLNNMYGLSLSQHEKVPGLLLKLSSLLRYSVYDAKELYVPLKSELDYINNYIDFEKIRIGNKLVLSTSLEDTIDPETRIAPLLLIVFIENAFKHAKNTTEQKIFVEITLKTWGNSILFSVKNSNNGVTNENSILNKNSGFGLDNVTKRLELLYKNNYDLVIQDQDGFYSVMLQLKRIAT